MTKFVPHLMIESVQLSSLHNALKQQKTNVAQFMMKLQSKFVSRQVIRSVSVLAGRNAHPALNRTARVLMIGSVLSPSRANALQALRENVILCIILSMRRNADQKARDSVHLLLRKDAIQSPDSSAALSMNSSVKLLQKL